MRQRSNEKVRGTAPQTVRKDREEVQQASEEIPWPPVKKTMETEVVSLQSVKEHSKPDIHTAAQGRHHNTRQTCPEKKQQPIESPCRSRFSVRIVGLGGPKMEQSIPEKLYAMERTQVGVGLEE